MHKQIFIYLFTFFYNNLFNDFYFMHLNGANVGRKDKENNHTDAIMCFQIPISHPEFCKLNKVIYLNFIGRRLNKISLNKR